MSTTENPEQLDIQIEALREEIEDLACNNEHLRNVLEKYEKELSHEDIEKFEEAARFFTSYAAMYHRRSAQLELANKRIETLESDLVDAYSKITTARDTALRNLQEMDNEKQIDAMNEVIDCLPDKAE